MKLYIRDNKGKIKVNDIVVSKVKNTYHITINTGLLNTKLVKHAPIIIKRGLADRSLQDQSQRVFNRLIIEKKNKGYRSLKDLNLQFSTDINRDLELCIINSTPHTNGSLKPLLFNNSIDIDDYVFVNLKSKGTRATFQNEYFYGEDSKAITTSTSYLREKLDSLCIAPLDGELYFDSAVTNQYNKIKNKKLLVIHQQLKYRIYDILIDKPLHERIDQLRILSQTLKNVEVVLPIKVFTNEELKELHTQAIKDGYEGLIVRKPNSMYNYGRKDKGYAII